MGEAAAAPTFVVGAPGTGGPAKLVGAYGPEFAPNPALYGLAAVGAAVEVPGRGNSGLLPELDGAVPGTWTFSPVLLFGGTCPAYSGLGSVAMSVPRRDYTDLHGTQAPVAFWLKDAR